MKHLLQLRADKSALVAKSKAILDAAQTENRSLNGDEAKQAKSLNQQISDINTHIDLAEQTAAEERYVIACTQGKKADKPTNTELRNFVLTGRLENRSLSIAAPADGGYTVVPALDKMITAQLREAVTLYGLATVKTISGQTYEKNVSVGGSSSGWAAESATRDETNTSKLSKVAIGVNALYAFPKTTMELLDMSDFDVEGWLAEETSEQFGEDLNISLFNGDGTGKPKGILTYTRSASPTFGEIKEVTSAASGVIDLHELM